MTVAELSALLHGLAPAVRDFVLSGQKAITDRLTALETQDQIPGEKGEKGNDGKDGLGFDDFDWEYDEVGRLYAKYQRGDVVKRARVPGHTFRGVFKNGETYLSGDTVIWGGGEFTALVDTNGSVAPDADVKASQRVWGLSTMRGKQGTTGQKGEKGDPGTNGRDGQDIRRDRY